jgi:methyl-accepting chemotaxis protein
MGGAGLENRVNMTIGKKLSVGFAAMLVMTAILAVTSLTSIASLGEEFDHAANKTAKKLDIAASMATNASEMLSFERGVLVRLNMKDIPKAEGYHNSFNERARLITEAGVRLRPLIETQQAQHDLDVLEAGVAAWVPAHQQLWQMGRNGDLEGALTIYDQKTLPIAKEIQKGADSIMQAQRRLLAEGLERGHSAISRNRWIAVILSTIFLVVGAVVLFIVQRSAGELRRAAAELDENAAQIAEAASQVALSSQSLAQGASEQAASLEETSASTEEITSMTRKNAENTRTAAGVMDTVDQHVKKGNLTLDEMLVSMDEINTSSDKIAKIIKVIDEIAFQTNILALNAAVEAARAGEAGMGFAVVANEVRNLAQRAAQAAKDTAPLIEESIHSSHQGSVKLQQVSGVIRAITESAAEVKTLVDGVNLGSQEQSRGIDQIARAITQMDQVTQGTAASAEESAAAAAELSAQAEALSGVVQRLRLMVGSGA